MGQDGQCSAALHGMYFLVLYNIVSYIQLQPALLGKCVQCFTCTIFTEDVSKLKVEHRE